MRRRWRKNSRSSSNGGVDVVLDYVWGESAEALLVAAAKAAPEAVPIRFVGIGSVGGPTISLPSAVLRSSTLELMGSGINSIPAATPRPRDRRSLARRRRREIRDSHQGGAAGRNRRALVRQRFRRPHGLHGPVVRFAPLLGQVRPFADHQGCVGWDQSNAASSDAVLSHPVRSLSRFLLMPVTAFVLQTTLGAAEPVMVSSVLFNNCTRTREADGRPTNRRPAGLRAVRRGARGMRLDWQGPRFSS